MILDESIALLIVGIGQPVGDLQCPIGGLSIGKLREEPPALAEGFLDTTLLLEVGIEAVRFSTLPVRVEMGGICGLSGVFFPLPRQLGSRNRTAAVSAAVRLIVLFISRG